MLYCGAKSMGASQRPWGCAVPESPSTLRREASCVSVAASRRSLSTLEDGRSIGFDTEAAELQYSGITYNDSIHVARRHASRSTMNQEISGNL